MGRRSRALHSALKTLASADFLSFEIVLGLICIGGGGVESCKRGGFCLSQFQGKDKKGPFAGLRYLSSVSAYMKEGWLKVDSEISNLCG